MEIGADHGMWTFARYRSWMANRRDWYVPPKDQRDQMTEEPTQPNRAALPTAAVATETNAPARKSRQKTLGGRIEIEPDEGGLEKILKRLT
jgi:hypothetical protein